MPRLTESLWWRLRLSLVSRVQFTCWSVIRMSCSAPREPRGRADAAILWNQPKKSGMEWYQPLVGVQGAYPSFRLAGDNLLCPVIWQMSHSMSTVYEHSHTHTHTHTAIWLSIQYVDLVLTLQTIILTTTTAYLTPDFSSTHLWCSNKLPTAQMSSLSLSFTVRTFSNYVY